MKIKISVDGGCDLPQEIMEKYDITFLPIPKIADGVEYMEYTNKEIYEYYKNNGTLVKTAAPSEYEFEEYYRALSESADHVIHYNISSKASVSYTNAVNAAKKYNNVTVIDTKQLSAGVGIIVMHTIDDINAGKTIEEIIDNIHKNIEKVDLSFIVSNLEFLYKNGRCSKAGRFLASALGITPSIVMREDGTLDSGKKYKLNKKNPKATIIKFAEESLSKSEMDKSYGIILYSSEKNEIVDELLSMMTEKGIQNVCALPTNPVISCHCGPETYGIVYMNI